MCISGQVQEGLHTLSHLLIVYTLSLIHILTILLADFIVPALPYLLAFAAGAMLYVVVEELIPESAEGEHSNLGTFGFAVGFLVMMILDVALG